MRNNVAVLALMVAMGATGCSNTTPACVSGQLMTCVCPGGGAGTQACSTDGTGYGACTGCAAATDMASVDFATAYDLTTPPDLLASAGDLNAPSDSSTFTDAVIASDLSIPDLLMPDLQMPDFTPPVDMTKPPKVFSLAAHVTNYPADFNSQGVAVGDVNGDGKLDFALANTDGRVNHVGSVSVFLNHGDGTYFAAANYTAGTYPISVAFGDLNGDGTPDLVVANSKSNNVSVLLNAGNGSFAAAVNFAAGTNPASVAVGDFNGDGKADVAVGNYQGSNVSVLLNKGDGSGTLLAAVNYAVGSGAGTQSIAIGDLNGDGKPDLAAAIYDVNSVAVLINKGDGSGTFLSPVNYAPGTLAVAVAIGDLNGDGKADLAVSGIGGKGSVGVLLNSGNGAFAVAANYGTSSAAFSIAIGDVNGDGKPDLTYADNGNSWASVLLNNVNGNGTFTVAPNAGALYANDNAWAIALGDVNGDGRLDMVTANPAAGDASVVLNNGAGGNGAFGDGFPAGTTPTGVALGDLDGDGKPDVAVANAGSNNVSVLLSRANNTLTAAVNYLVGTSPYAVAVGDLNGDGKPDLVAANRGSNNLSVLLNKGDGTATLLAAVNYATGALPYAVAVADFNGDGKPDVATANESGNSASVLLNKGDGTGTLLSAVSYATGNTAVSVAAGDVNGDGKPDLVVANYSGNNVSVLVNKGDGSGTFLAAVNYAAGGNSPYSVAVGDLNGDGKPDLAVATYSTNSVNVLLNNGSGTFAAAVAYPTGGAAWSVAIADLNGDGVPDLAVANDTNSNSHMSAFLNLGNGTFGAMNNSYFAGGGPTSVGVGDINGDGLNDVAFADNFGGVTVLFNSTH